MIDNLVNELARLRMEKVSCPCNYTTPCRDSCTCATPLLSGGCDRCCGYGSLEQRKDMAETLVNQIKILEKALDNAVRMLNNTNYTFRGHSYDHTVDEMLQEAKEELC